MTAEWGVAESRHSQLGGIGDRRRLIKPSENPSLVIVSANFPVFTDQGYGIITASLHASFTLLEWGGGEARLIVE